MLEKGWGVTRIPLERLTTAFDWHRQFYAVPIRRILKMLATGRDEYGRAVVVKFFRGRKPAPNSVVARQYFLMFEQFNSKTGIVLAKPDELAQLISKEAGCPARGTADAKDALDFLSKLFDYRHFYAGQGPRLELPPLPKRTRASARVKTVVARIKFEDNTIMKNPRRAGGEEKWDSWRFIRELGDCGEQSLKVCPYCNADRIYALEIEKTGRLALARSALDHYYSQRDYPYLGCSLYNLIPACTRCNSPFKGVFPNHPTGRRIIHPYGDDFHRVAKFTWGNLKNDAVEGKINPRKYAAKIVPRRSSRGDWARAREAKKLFQLESVYTQMYADDACRVAEVMHNVNCTWPEETLRQLGFAATGVALPPIMSHQERKNVRRCVKEMLLHCSFDANKINAEPLSKFKIDLADELEA